jgi:U4/U6 small nuclear ribonucleoprotein PRP3
MKVLANDAIQDPTKVEAAVRRQVENRRLKHEKTNEINTLTPEQRREKLARKEERDEGKGLYAAVFK